MIKGLPRPFLWTEIKTIDEFLKGDFLTEVLYGTFKDLHGSLFLPYVDEVAFFNELFYQLTRYYYEKPKPDDYIRYMADIRSNLGQVCYADLVMTMMFHYCRLKNISYPIDNDGFMRTIRYEQEQKDYWRYFSIIKSTVFRWMELVPYPQKPCPVAPEKLRITELNWDKITHNYNLSVVKDILNLWEKEDDRAEVAMLIKENCGVSSFLSRQKNIEYREVVDYLEEVTGEKYEEKDMNVYIKKLKQEIEALKEKLRKAEELDKKRIEDIDSWHNAYEDNLARVYEWESMYEKEVEKNKKAEYLREEYEKIKQENVKLRVKIEQLKAKLDEDGLIVETAKKYLGDQPFSPEIILKRFVKDEEYEKKEKILEGKIKELQDKLGEETAPLSVLAEGLKEYAEAAGISAAYELFCHLTTMLINIPAWTKNVPELKKFFKKARKEMEKGITNIEQQNNFANVGTYNDKVDTQNNIYPAMQLGQQGQKQLEE